ncbi:MmcQ/YjbR family DNA-binding protein [Streptomyces sp. TRM66268-LWL]|uniref:MmcQ/YjbR family DNA-binding protein n=1 Tax=Streptomyces polyasparticus TaxID=2767826 RepID=A0ABR7SRT2_9ACTN|nr:MmcQ/YjbR family DNA-binding protein [Streptomyces polyasparticus]MBC9717504.1 MmcQ/YjbR family DNA-binding protein [Streptomyces polyasparticus]
MPHPVMFEDDDPYLVRLRRLALMFPDAQEQISHGRPGFRAGKFFAWYGGSTKVSADTRVPYDRGLIVLPDESDRAALAEDERFFAPAYLAPSGWIGIDLAARGTTAPEDVDWAEVAELLDASYRRVAGVRRVARLDKEGGPPRDTNP